MNLTAVITVGIDPEIQLGPLTLAWHGFTIALGIVIGAVVAGRCLRERGLSSEPMQTFALLAALGGIVGARLFYIVERDPGALLAPNRLLSSNGFTLDGGLVLAAVLIAAYVARTGLSGRYLDAGAVGLPLGLAIGRIGDIINGEHYGSPSNSLLAVRNSNPDARTPDPTIAYHNGGLYEFLMGMAIFAIAWPLRQRLKRPGDLAWLVLGLIAVGRFLVFFYRSDSPPLALGMDNAQWTSIVLVAVIVAGRTLMVRRADSHANTTSAARPS